MNTPVQIRKDKINELESRMQSLYQCTRTTIDVELTREITDEYFKLEHDYYTLTGRIYSLQ